jgi:hypothetical protein
VAGKEKQSSGRRTREKLVHRCKLAHRCCAPTRGFLEHLATNNGSIEYPGCKASFKTWAEFSFHVSNCARVPGNNVSSGHALIKDVLKDIFHQCGVQFDSAEPRDLRTVICPGCAATVFEDKWQEHVTSCCRCNSQTPNPRGSGPDIRIRIHTKVSKHPITFTPAAICIDVTQVSTRCASNASKTIAETFAQREKIKHDKYLASCHAAEQDFVVFAVNEDGQMNDDAKNLLEIISRCERAPPIEEIRRRIQQAALTAHANALANAMKKLHINSNSRFNSELLDRASRTANYVAECEIIARNPDFTAINASANFPQLPPPGATAIYAERTVRRDRSVSSDENSIAVPDNTVTMLEEAARLERVRAEKERAEYTKIQSFQILRNAEIISSSQAAAASLINARPKRLPGAGDVLCLDGDSSPVRQRILTQGQDISQFRYLLANTAQPRQVLHNFTRQSFSGATENVVMSEFLQYANQIWNKPSNPIRQAGKVTHSAFNKLIVDFQNSLDTNQSRARPGNGFSPELAQDYFEALHDHPHELDWVRHTFKALLHAENCVDKNGLIVAPIQVISTAVMSHQNNNSQTNTSGPNGKVGSD